MKKLSYPQRSKIAKKALDLAQRIAADEEGFAEKHYDKEFDALNKLALQISRALISIQKNGAKLAEELAKIPEGEVATRVTVEELNQLVDTAKSTKEGLFGWGGMSFAEPTNKK